MASPNVNKNNGQILGDAKLLIALALQRMTRSELTDLLLDLKMRAGSDQALAHKIGYRASNHIPNLLRRDNPITPNAQTCLRIARFAGRHPSEILRAAGHGDLVEIIEESYGPERAVPVEAPDRSADECCRACLALPVDLRSAAAAFMLKFVSASPVPSREAARGASFHRDADADRRVGKKDRRAS